MDRLSRLVPLTGVVFVVLTVVSFFMSNSSPDSNASGQKVITFYVAHRSSQRASDLLLGLALVFFVFFIASLYGYLRSSPTAGNMPLVGFGGALVMVVGFALFGSIDFALADVPGKLSPSTAQALNLLENDMILPLAVGAITFGIAIGLAIARSGLLPAWLGAAIAVLGILAGTPAAIIGLFGLLAWTLVMSILLYLRSGSAARAEEPGVAPVPA